MQYSQCIQGGWEELGCQRCWQPSFFVQRKSRGVSETRSPCPRRGRGNSRPSKEGGEEDQLHSKYSMSDDGSNLIAPIGGDGAAPAMLDLKGLFLVPIFVRLGEPCEARTLQAVGRANAQRSSRFSRWRKHPFIRPRAILLGPGSPQCRLA
jgi:hypothetical protein